MKMVDVVDDTRTAVIKTGVEEEKKFPLGVLIGGIVVVGIIVATTR